MSAKLVLVIVESFMVMRSRLPDIMIGEGGSLHSLLPDLMGGRKPT